MVDRSIRSPTALPTPVKSRITSRCADPGFGLSDVVVVEGVVPRSAAELVKAFAAEQFVGPSLTEDAVVAASAGEAVVPSAAVKDVVVFAAT